MGYFSRGKGALFVPLVDNLLDHDSFLLLADHNVARMGKFSSDRSIREYCDNILKTKPIKKRLHCDSERKMIHSMTR